MIEPESAAEPDLSLPSAARVYDFLLGGGHNFAVDRAIAERIIQAVPTARETAVANRAFLGRAVRACLDRGCRQFLDLGSGIPTVEPVHEIAHRCDPSARIAYVDTDPVAVSISRDLLAGVDRATITAADLTDPEAVLSAPGVAGLLDPAEPTVVLAVSVLHYVGDDELVARLLDRYCSAFGPGSMLVFSHGSTDVDDPAAVTGTEGMLRLARDSGHPIVPRDRATLRRMTAGVDLLEPGLVDVSRWRVDDPDPGPVLGVYGLVGTVRGQSR
ncbi:SAM-dependent methyltransferase [Pseudonocardia sp. NPDC049635]|uniref:SAM-dependent methyltransferase n=1 Tax=Pseudonocardia sp. NPDC049635 TaxID=3155506 RepID=UPI0033C03408